VTELPTGTVTFLFTDLESSTRLWEQHPDAMRHALSRHDAILRASIEAHEGQIVKMTGDGVHAVFTSAPEAVLAASDALKSIASEAWDATGPLAVRFGIHTGVAEFRDGDYPGGTVNRANRVMTAAHGGQAVMSASTADSVRHALPDGLRLVDLGEHRLRGLAQPEHLYQLSVAGLRSEFPPLRSIDAFPGAVPLPPVVFARDEQGVVGREAELETLQRAWQRAAAGQRQVVMIGGDPGIGKTSLVGEFSRRVYAGQGVVLYGRCDEEGVIPYQPFVEALRSYVAACPVSTLRERLHGLEADLARVFPELLGRMPELAASLHRENDAGLSDRLETFQTERYRLFQAFTVLITGVAATQPVFFVLDDVHWADRPTLQLCRHLFRSAPHAPLLAVACYRDRELVEGQPLSEVLSELRREPSVAWLTLRGLSRTASAELARAVAGDNVSPALIEALHRETGGNPFFLEEVLRHLIEIDAPIADDELADGLGALDLPQGVREVVTRRVRRLPDAVGELLSLASVVGPEFDATLLAQLADLPIDAVLDRLDDATAAGLVTERQDRIGQYAFAHALIRQTIYAELKTAQRVRLHALVAEAIEGATTSGAKQARTAVALAQHFTAAIPLVGATKAIRYTAEAGRDAVSDLAFEDGVLWFERAVNLLEAHEPHDVATRVELLIDYADALVFVDERAGAEAALKAVREARDALAAQFGRAVAVFAEPNHAATAYPSELALLFDEAQAALGDDQPALRARLLAREAFKYTSYQLARKDGRALARASVALARETTDELTLCDALFALATSLEGSVDLSERIALGEELVSLGRGSDPRSSTYGLRILAGAYLERADPDALRSTLDELSRIGDAVRWQPARVAAAQWRATQALLEGRFTDMRAHLEEMGGYRRAYGGVSGMRTVQTFFLAREQGRLADAAPLARMVDESGGNLYARALLALAQVESDDTAGARQTLAVVEDPHFREHATEGAWVAIVVLLAEAAVTVGSQDHAMTLYRLLEPYAGRLATAHLGLACLGATDRHLGMLSTTLGRWDVAEAHFERALALEAGMGGAALLPRTKYWRASLYEARGRVDDVRHAADLFNEVVVETSRLGMQRLCAQARDRVGDVAQLS
jgi:class 3 adenylate cyclase